MTAKTAYIWGPVSSFTGPLAAWLIKKGWTVHLACKSSLNLLSLSPLDLRSTAESAIDVAFGGHDKAKAFHDKIKIADPSEFGKGTRYDAVIFAGLPPNFDEPRTPRAPWSASEIKDILSIGKEAALVVVSSLYGGVQADGVVPEEIEFSRRKPGNNWENICQQYEGKLFKELSKLESPWHLVRLPMMCGSTDDAQSLNFTGLYGLLKSLADKAAELTNVDFDEKKIRLGYNPNSTLWYMPVDTAVYTFWRFLEDENRPRILNLIPTNAKLNREWLQFLSKALNVKSITASPEDDVEVSTVLHKLLGDDVQVKNRNLFEVAGRYHIPPVPVDEEYFNKILLGARANNWGKDTVTREPEPPIIYSDRLANFYFGEFLPAFLNSESYLDKALKKENSIGFVINDSADLGWVIKAENGHSIVTPYEPSGAQPKVMFRMSGDTLLKLIKGRPLYRAMLARDIDVQGPLLTTLKVANLVERHLKDHPVESAQLAKLNENVKV